jgi:hypothetical protein
VGGFTIEVGARPHDFSYYPYVDSLRYFGHDGRLRMQNSHSCIVLDQTNGGPNDEDYVTLENGDRVPEDDARYSNLFGGLYHRDECTWSDLHDDWIPDDQLVELHCGAYTYCDNDELVQLHDNNYALLDDCVQLHDGEYALHADAQELHDGEYALHADAQELHDGEYALKDDCTEQEDGTYVLTATQEN